MSNTIRIKRSTTVATPTSLSQGELAYSESSDNLFIGTNSGSLQKIGGNADVVKLATIESGATADQTNTEIRDAVESASNSNTFTDADHSKLNAIAASANNYVLPASVIHQTELSSSTSSTSTTVAANSAAVKAAYDKGSHSHPYLSTSHDASAVTTAKIGEWDAAHTWYDSMTTADADGVIDTVNEIVAVFQNHSESLNLITELDAKLTADSTIDGGTF